jgi:hypothetical protein
VYESVYLHTFIIIILYLFAAHNIPLQVSTDDGNMEMDISQGEPPKANEQAENVMRQVCGFCVVIFFQKLVFWSLYHMLCTLLYLRHCLSHPVYIRITSVAEWQGLNVLRFA